MDINESFTGKIGKIINDSFSIGTLPKVKRLELQVLGVAHAGDYCERLCCPRRHDWICSRGNMYTYIYITCCVKCGRNHDFFPSQLHWFRDLFHPKLGFPPNRGTFRGLCTRGRVQLDNQSLGHCSCASLSVVYETGYASRTWMI